MTLKKALQTLRDIESDDGFSELIVELVEQRIKGHIQYMVPQLTEGDKLFLHKHEMEFEYDNELKEYIINLT